MKYMGSKNRIASEILPIILKNRTDEQWYVEPFCGGCNTLDKVEGKRIGNDFNTYLILMWQAIQKGWIPPTNITKDDYSQIKKEKHLFSPALVGWVGIGCSYSGKWFGGYAGKTNTKIGTVRDYILESQKAIIKQKDGLIDVVFYNLSYNKLIIPNNSIVYCDPPYEGTTKYENDFDHKKFWDWCRDMIGSGHKVFVSEYNAPDDFVCVWQKQIKSSLSANGKIGGSKKSIEKLFIHESQQ